MKNISDQTLAAIRDNWRCWILFSFMLLATAIAIALLSIFYRSFLSIPLGSRGLYLKVADGSVRFGVIHQSINYGFKLDPNLDFKNWLGDNGIFHLENKFIPLSGVSVSWWTIIGSAIATVLIARFLLQRRVRRAESLNQRQ